MNNDRYRPLVLRPLRGAGAGAHRNMRAGAEVKPPQRPSILLRPKTKASRNNIETADAQWEHEQQRLAAARRRREEQDAERMRWHGSARGDPGDKALVQCARAASPALHAPCILQPCALHCRARCTARCTAVHAGHPPHAPILQPCILRREAVQSDMRMQAAARDEAVQREELLSSQVKATVATRADLEKELEERQSDARRELQQRRRL